MTGMELFQTWIVAFFTLALFSFLYKDNPFYKFAEHVFAGLSAGYYVGLVWHTVILQQLWDPMFNPVEGASAQWFLIIPGILGLLMFARFFPKVSWVSRISLAVVMAFTAGEFLSLQLHGLVLPQMLSTMKIFAFENGASFGNVIWAIIVLVGVVSTLVYFYYSKEHKGVIGVTAKVGIWFIMVSFGAHFGYTVMGRVSLLIGRVQFLYDDWLLGSIDYF